MWVGHPATLQAGVFIWQELSSRPAVLEKLREQARQQPAGAPGGDWKQTLLSHVLECLRLRTPVPLVPRVVLRSTSMSQRDRHVACPAEATVLVSLTSSLNDGSDGRPADGYQPEAALDSWNCGRHRPPIFGMSPRPCVAREHVPEVLVSVFDVLLRLPPMTRAGPLAYEGPIVTHFPLRKSR
jgi:cytochrome P450